MKVPRMVVDKRIVVQGSILTASAVSPVAFARDRKVDLLRRVGVFWIRGAGSHQYQATGEVAQVTHLVDKPQSDVGTAVV
jgi:hypothetical protein